MKKLARKTVPTLDGFSVQPFTSSIRSHFNKLFEKVSIFLKETFKIVSLRIYQKLRSRVVALLRNCSI